MKNDQDLDAQILSDFQELSKSVSPRYIKISSFLFETLERFDVKSNNYVNFFVGNFVQIVYGDFGIDVGIAREIGFQLEAIHLLHNFRLNLPWTTAGNIRTRPMSIFPKGDVIAFGYELQTRLSQRLLDTDKHGLSPSIALKVSEYIQKSILSLIGIRSSIASNNIEVAPDNFAISILLSASISLLEVLSDLDISPNFNELAMYCATIRQLSIIERIINSLDSQRHFEEVELVKQEYYDLGATWVIQQNNKDMQKSSEIASLNFDYFISKGFKQKIDQLTNKYQNLVVELLQIDQLYKLNSQIEQLITQC